MPGSTSSDAVAGPLAVRPTRTRTRLSRTVSLGRWREYQGLLGAAITEGYTILSLERWLDAGGGGDRVLILRHDVDQCPRAALRMLAIERALGVSSTWYFRWRTARLRAISAVRSAGGEVGLHYETLSRMTMARQAADLATEREAATKGQHLIDSARLMLKRELVAFAVLFGPVRSACAHGDTRAPKVNNACLLRDVDLDEYGLRYDANASLRAYSLALWLTDRSGAEGGWRDGLNAFHAIESHVSPVLLLTHPNNWVSGAGLWRDRLLRATLREPRLGSARTLRSGSDQPPLLTDAV
jgi:hypothetical protein